MGIGKLLLREKTLPTTRGTTTFYSSTTYVPVYGKTTFKVGGRGTPGNPSTGGTYAGTNPSSGGNTSYNPPTGGNIANYNPSTPGNYVSTNPTVPGNYLGTNPPSGGNASYNPSTGGTYAGSNPAIYIYGVYVTSYQYSNTYAIPPSTNPSSYTYSDIGTYQNQPTYVTYTVLNYGLPSRDNLTEQADYQVYNTPKSSYSYYHTDGGTYYSSLVEYFTDSYTAATPYYNPTVPGNIYYNPVNPGNPYYNPPVPGTANYNPPVSGTANYNPIVPGNPYTNPISPGNPYYNPVTPGNPGANANYLGIAFPGGLPGQPAPLVTPTSVSMSYTPGGLSVTVPPGGYIDITNT